MWKSFTPTSQVQCRRFDHMISSFHFRLCKCLTTAFATLRGGQNGSWLTLPWPECVRRLMIIHFVETKVLWEHAKTAGNQNSGCQKSAVPIPAEGPAVQRGSGEETLAVDSVVFLCEASSALETNEEGGEMTRPPAWLAGSVYSANACSIFCWR